MAENKKSFIAYCDWKSTFDALPDDKAGQLIKHIFSYVSDENPKTEDILINAVFANIKESLKRDLKKWEKQHQQRIDAGKRSAEKRKENSTSVERALNERSISSTVNVNDSVSVNVNDTVNDILLKKETKKFSFKNSLLNYGFEKKLVEEWMSVRKTKKATNTETSYESFITEVEKTGEDKNVILKLCVEKDWKGFKSSWEWKEGKVPQKENDSSKSKDYEKWIKK